ncbi:MAG TPA: bifunctional [glutamate--ammonia ligase]-adenylyl-L-tyrosine phosphorylase/[glutamate--ammonia-ligase] adenylyltransferase [Kofleriaceae bacterium]|nr:bifunctional [glutamate--ammonia ligase]-adenylyl-L-tyrosine phosphorylase/[glutamate--ammonia-ligase] adenylyltransferase [Kofleriaceae bacterium]
MIRPADLAMGAPDEADALRRAERLFDAAAQSGLDITGLDAAAHRIATLACQSAPYLATLLTRDPQRLVRVATDPYLRREKPREVLANEVAARAARAKTAPQLQAALRRVRADELVRLGVRELELGLDTEVGRELARLADACFDAAIAFWDRELRARYGPPRYVDDDGAERDAHLVVIGMGKLGGEELNFSSDVDVIYVYSSDQGEAGGISLHEYFAKLCTCVTQALSESTEDDMVFRVDLRLRPEGAKGAIANSLASTERYYETFGRPWERQAWLKARSSAGDAALGAEVMRTLRPFVYPRLNPPTVIDDVRDLNRRIKRELVRPARGGGGDGFDLKNGEGGIREIEFFVQALQLIHAGKRPALRLRGTLAALDALLFAGLITDDEHFALFRAYRWLRHTEHVLQLEGGLQTQIVPDDDARRLVLARRLGYPSDVAFAIALVKHTGAVSRLFATLGDPADGRAEVAAVLRGELTEAAEIDALTQLGFADATAARAELARARRNSDSPLATAAVASERTARIGAALLAEIAASADPDQALRTFGDLIARRGAAWSVWRLLDENPPIVRLLGSIFGASAYLARTLVDTPELIDLLTELGQTAPSRSVAQVAADLELRLASAEAADPEAVWNAIAEVKNGHVLRVGLADFAGVLDPLAVCAELTAIAEACLDRALAVVEDQLVERHGRPPGDARLAVLGLGKLGGYELGYAADLDVVFVYTGDDGESDGAAPLATVEWFSRCAQRLLNALRQRTPRGRLYEIDTRLRPSGSQGLLVTSLAGWRRYHAEDARLWERQALIKLRPVAGDRALGEQVAQLAADTVYGQPIEAASGARAIADAILQMRDRIERELGADPSGKRHTADLKVGAGGVIDVEFAAQYIQLVHGHAHAALRTTGTAPALEAAAAAGVIPARDAELLAQGYRFLRKIEHRLRVVHDQPIHRLPEARGEIDKLARRSGFPDGGVLLEHVERWQSEIRAAYLRLLSAPPARAGA